MKKEQVKKLEGSARFFVNDGTIIESLADLPRELRRMPTDVFQRHVNEKKHDFAIWVDSSIGHKILAEKMRQCTTKIGLAKIVSQELTK